jgi:hypothetical protein
MYESLKKVCRNFRLFVFAFDQYTYEFLKKKKLKNIILIKLEDFEDAALKRVKKERSKVEYMWTSTPSTILYLFKKYKMSSATYLDADIYFYRNPRILLQEAKNDSVLITEHRFLEKYDYSHKYGIYNVQFVFFKNNSYGIKVLKDWRKSCIKWCFDIHGNGLSGDQKYLDEWPKKFKKIKILENLGGGLGPWNIQRYNVIKNRNNIKMQVLDSKKYFNRIFYHFSSLKFLNSNQIFCGDYKLSKTIINYFYIPYIEHLIRLRRRLSNNFQYNNRDISKISYKFNLYRKIIFIIKILILKKNILSFN